MTTPTTKVPAKLQKFLDDKLPVKSASSRSVQRVAALWLGHNDGKIEPAALRDLCTALKLFDYAGREGQNNFGANFTMNMRKDAAYFDGDKTGWKLTAAGKAEAKNIFEDGGEPTLRRVEGGAKPKAAKPKAPAKKAEKAKPAAAKPKAKAAPKKAEGKKAKKAEAAPAETAADRTAAAKRARLAKKRDLGNAGSPESAPATPEPASAPAG